MSFLKAEWRKLAIANYVIDEQLLQPYLPYHTELDQWKGETYVSLIGFMFVNTKILGLKIPFHTNFEEVNLRFYVKYKEEGQWKRGVVFIKEIVPRSAITFVANTFYNENYVTQKMNHFWDKTDKEQIIKYQWQHKNQWQSITLNTALEALPIPAGSKTEFITEHYWGYTKIGEKTTSEYEVRHPRWLSYKVNSYDIDVDFGLVYGSSFQTLNNVKPVSVMLAEGSEISVEYNKKLK